MERDNQAMRNGLSLKAVKRHVNHFSCRINSFLLSIHVLFLVNLALSTSSKFHLAFFSLIQLTDFHSR